MAIPSSVLAAGWVPFVVIIFLVLLFSTIYIKFYMSKYDGTTSSTVSAVVALSITLMTTALVPVDVFLVSYMKDHDGQFKDWANTSDARTSIENSVMYAYYTFYGLIVFCLFLMLPFMYFFYEEKDEETSTKARCCSALKYTIGFVIIVAVLLLIGLQMVMSYVCIYAPFRNVLSPLFSKTRQHFLSAFVPNKVQPKSNSTDWKKIEALFHNISSNGFEDSLSFIISCLSLFGMCALVTYTAYGMSALPMGFIKGKKGATKERMQVQSKRSSVRERIDAIKDKYSGRNMSNRRRENLSDLEESERLMDRQEKHLVAKETSKLQRCLVILRPFEVVFGILFFLITLLIFISLLLTNIDKTMHSLGYKMGYALPHRTLPNPVDIVLVFCQKVFPLDYVMFSLMVVYIILCSMDGIRNIGIWFFWLRMYKIRPRRTRPQGILMLCMILMFIMLAINVIIYELTPQYSTFGSQKYMVSKNTTVGNSTSVTHTSENCTTETADCVFSRMALLLTRFFYKMWFFGAAYYWITWAFLGFMLLGFIIAVIKKRKSAIDGEVEDDDFDDSDDEMLRP